MRAPIKSTELLKGTILVVTFGNRRDAFKTLIPSGTENRHVYHTPSPTVVTAVPLPKTVELV